ncbi:ABC transporter, ATP-binding protein [[Clostridium] methylpentosum DSM 5476]|jgi:ABC-2 type transport system ATP-binding protein|uniref:ABC transporter, ATP-binding protein n=1 Tax=[Clostridium] methylpentosum DSM 5476 TaxID=537013 RepID=C0EEH3_9FIRM|nr:ABC transporter, ATP-binding protein [[Clostridium] methylpentosum DSM 5476]MDY3989288.1 ABC transporter ATP-binding protein [Massilioclostridium sp.]
MKDFVSVSKLTKKYGELCAVDNLSFTVREGEIFGFLGPNGAGKSTTLNVLTTLSEFNSGEVSIGGYDLVRQKDKIKGLIGMVPQSIAVYPTLTAAENVTFFASLYGLSGKKLHSAVDEALDFVGISDHRKIQARRLSGGMQRRLNIACGIVHTPKLIVMDEPTVGVDAQSREQILHSINILRDRGATVIYTSHYMPEVQEICDRIAIVDKGRLVACGTEQELVTLVTDISSVYVGIRFPSDFQQEALKKRLLVIPDVRAVTIRESEIRLDVSLGFSNISPVLKVCMEMGLSILSVNSESPNLETTFLALTGHDLH